jgi:hypothetical protein
MLNKIFIYYTTIIFIYITILIVILLNFYYITPNNYKIINLIDTNLIILYQKKIIIKPNEKYNLDYKLKSEYINFNKDTNVIISNFVKSQNITIDKFQILNVKFGSELIILNNTNSDINLKITFYKPSIID